jgi:hypothetical protein
MRQHKIVVGLESYQLIQQALFTLAKGVDPAPDGQLGAEHHSVFDAHDVSAPVGLDHLGLE